MNAVIVHPQRCNPLKPPLRKGSSADFHAGATPGAEWAAQFIDFVASDAGQKIIRDYGKAQYGQGLYDDAAYAKQYDD
jgi:hypothetical protein